MAFACGLSRAAMDPADVQTPIDMLRVVQIGPSQLDFIQDDRPIGEAELETLMQLLFRLPSFSQVDVDQWATPVNPAELSANPNTHRFSMFEIRGDITELKVERVLPELIPRVRFAEYYRLRIRQADNEYVVLSREIPTKWQESLADGLPIHESVRIQGLFLKRLPEAENTTLAFAASRVNWHPKQANPKLGISEDHVLLGQLGLDISRLSDVQQRSGMVGEDRECFYQMLSAVKLAEPQQLARLGLRTFDIGRMIKTPESCAGELYTLAGLARRAVLIHVNDEDIHARFGIDHYYEVEVFLPLEKNVRFTSKDDADGKLFTEYPFVICVPELPRGMDEGDDIRVAVTFSGFFAKLWAYRTEFMSQGPQAGAPKLQLSPLLIGPTVLPQVPPQTDGSRLELTIALMFTGCLFGIWLVLWRSSIRDRRIAKDLFRKHDPSESDGWSQL